MIEVLRSQDASEFLKLAQDYLVKNETENNLPLGYAINIQSAQIAQNNFDPIFITISDNAQVVGAGLRTTQDRPLMVTQMPRSAVLKLADWCNDERMQLAGIIGPLEVANQFNEAWNRLTQITSVLGLRLGVYELEKVIFPKDIHGELVEVEIKHRDIVLQFLEGFHADCFSHRPFNLEEAHHAFELYLKNKTLFLWKNSDETIVSCAANSRCTPHTGTISFVYTPPDLRGKGYASQCVAMLSQRILDRGKKRCNLFTDLSNPTSNSIYQKIGYKKIGENIEYRFAGV